jgi:hypothetical protein
VHIPSDAHQLFSHLTLQLRESLGLEPPVIAHRRHEPDPVVGGERA